VQLHAVAMSSMSFGKQVISAFNREKPNSSITQWVEILTSLNYDDEAYDGIPEIVDSINLQPTGPSEASRALRKKLKHGNAHNQYRALVILKALVENCGHKFQTTFADGQLTDALKHLATDSGTNPKVKKKLIAVFASWHSQFKTDPSMSLVAGLYKQHRPADRRRSRQQSADADVEQMLSNMGIGERPGEDISRAVEYERKRKEKEEKELAKKKAKEAKGMKEEAKRKRTRSRRQPFDFEKERPQVLTSIANASQAANNLVNAITLVNAQTDSLQANERVQECLERAKLCRKQIVRYIQLVENEELIGTLIDTNERIITALEMYDKLTTPVPPDPSEVNSAVQAGLAAANLSHMEGEVSKLQDQQRAAVSRVIKGGNYRGKDRQDSAKDAHLHPDLQDLSFGALGGDQKGLPTPLRPSLPQDGERASWQRRGSLSDFSSFEDNSSEEGRFRRDHVTVSDNDEGGSHVHHAGWSGDHKLVDVDDPFADPFAG